MFHHRIQNLFIVHSGLGETQLGGQWFLVSQALPGSDSGALIEPLQLSAAWRRFEILDDLDVNALILQYFQRLAGRTAHRIMIDCRFHFESVHCLVNRATESGRVTAVTANG